ncbi:MAG: polysaccharide export protein [Candidatus Omnitrophica bacterium]|nr:polysaccharide export protein [Candidatus Omnitrophota bacterium]
MKKILIRVLFVSVLLSGGLFVSPVWAQEGDNFDDYTVGVNDVLRITILQPDAYDTVVAVSPDGSITFPYIGSLRVKDLTIKEVKEKIEHNLADGYLRYPVVHVVLQESRSRMYIVYGEVMRPGTYPIGENSTVLSAISMAGGFSKFGSSSRVKVLRSREDGRPGYETIKVNIKAVMDGDSDADVLLRPGDMVVISEGAF